MKFIMFIFSIIVLISMIACAQPNTTTTYQVGIVNPLADRTYLYFNEIKTDTSLSRLTESMDYLSPNVSDLIKPLNNFSVVGDTLFGEFTIADSEIKRFIKHGLVSKNNNTIKYSAMSTTYWSLMDMLEAKPTFFVRKKK